MAKQELRNFLATSKEWETYLVNGKYERRIRFGVDLRLDDLTPACHTCKSKRGEFHLLGCINESGVCLIHKLAIDCSCPIREGEDV